jgi:hypothetical protein
MKARKRTAFPIKRRQVTLGGKVGAASMSGYATPGIPLIIAHDSSTGLF